MMWLWVCLYLD